MLSCINDIRRNVLPDSFCDFKGFEDVPEVQRDIINIAKKVGFDEVDKAYMEGLLFDESNSKAK